MLLDSGSSHCFIDQGIAQGIKGWQKLSQPVTVKVANGSEIPCAVRYPICCGECRGKLFRTHSRSYLWVVMM